MRKFKLQAFAEPLFMIHKYGLETLAFVMKLTIMFDEPQVNKKKLHTLKHNNKDMPHSKYYIINSADCGNV